MLAYYALTPEMITDLSGLFIADSQFYRAYWNQQQIIYRDCWNYYTGLILQNSVANQNEELEWPLRVNLVKQAVLLHSLYLWGEYREGGTLVQYIVQPKRRKTEDGKPLEAPRARAKELEEQLNTFLRLSGAYSMFREQGRLYNAYGGVYLKAMPDEESPTGITMAATPAEYCFPVWDPTDYRKLMRMHIARRIPVEAAEQQFGYKPGTQHQDVLVDYVETWTPDTYSIQVGTGTQRQDAVRDGKVLAGGYKCKHPVTGRKRLPWVYIPRFRTGRFYGDPLPMSLLGIQDEYNTRLADTGDAISQITHPTRYSHDTSGPANEPLILPAGPEVYNAGRTMPGMEAPFIGDLESPQLTEGVLQFNDGLLDLSRYISHISPVMVGLDEGSQRSGETLNIRAIPTVSTIDDYRAAWSEGLVELAEIYLMLSYGMDINGITKEHFDHEINCQYNPILPKERQANVEEQVTLVGSGLRSKKLALIRLGDVPDIDEELKEIEKDQQEALEQQKALQPDPQEELDLKQQEHDQKMQHQQESHDLKMKQAKETMKVKVQNARSRPRPAAK